MKTETLTQKQEKRTAGTHVEAAEPDQVGRDSGRLKTMHRHRVCSVTKLELEAMAGPLQHMEGAIVSRGQGSLVSIMPDKHVGRRKKAVRKLQSRLSVGTLWRAETGWKPDIAVCRE